MRYEFYEFKIGEGIVRCKKPKEKLSAPGVSAVNALANAARLFQRIYLDLEGFGLFA